MTSIVTSEALWPHEHTAQLIDWVDTHRQDFKESNVSASCTEASLNIPNNPRTGEKYTTSEIRKKLGYLKSTREKTFTWADVARNGKECLLWKSKSGSNDKNLTLTKSQPDSAFDNPNPTSPQNNQCEPESIAEVHASPLLEDPIGESTQPKICKSCDLFGINRQHLVVAANYEYLTSVVQQHIVLDDRVKRDMKAILENINHIVASLSESLDLSALPYPQFDVIEMRCPDTSILVHKAMGLSVKGPASLNHKLAMLGVRGQVRLTDWIHSIIGAAVHTWVFESSFPTSLTRPDNSFGALKDILDEKGLTNLKENLLSDLQHRNFKA